MMKTLLLSLVFSLALASSAFATKVGDTALVAFGCKSRTDVIEIVKAETTNHTGVDVLRAKAATGNCLVPSQRVPVVADKEYKTSLGFSVWRFQTGHGPLYTAGPASDAKNI